jgi:hypothetical protein
MPDTPAPDRLADALEAFLGRPRADEEPTQDWLARRAELAEFLEPMLVRDGGEAAPPPPRADAPRDVGPYRLLHELGRGGMGIVFEAQRRDDGTHAAVKLLPAARAWSAQAVERFRREARAAAKLDHPGIVRVLGSGTDDTPAGELHWLAMELVRGRSLRDAHVDVRTACDGDPEAMPSGTRLGLASNDPTAPYWHEVAELGAQLADALAHAHAQGVVHRDVKPQNVLIDAHGRGRRGGCGHARDEQEQTLTRSGDFAGTPHYTSPEQISGPRDAIDGRSDLFSLGVLLFELLAMRRPFQGDDATAVLDAIRHSPAPSLRVLAPSTPKGLATIVTRLLEKRARERPATAALVAADLRAVRDGGSVAMRPIPARVLAMRFVQRHPVAVLAALVAVLTAIGTPAAVAFHLHRTQAAVAAEQTRTARNYARARLAIESQLHEVAAVDLDDVPGMAALRLRLFASARDLYRELLTERPDDLAMARLVAKTSAGVAHASLALGRAREAIVAFDEAQAIPMGDEARAPRQRPSAHAGRATRPCAVRPPSASPPRRRAMPSSSRSTTPNVRSRSSRPRVRRGSPHDPHPTGSPSSSPASTRPRRAPGSCSRCPTRPGRRWPRPRRDSRTRATAPRDACRRCARRSRACAPRSPPSAAMPRLRRPRSARRAASSTSASPRIRLRRVRASRAPRCSVARPRGACATAMPRPPCS